MLNPQKVHKESNYNQKIGMAPGQSIYTGNNSGDIMISLIVYDFHTVEEFQSTDFNEIVKKINPEKVNWINFDGISNTEIISSVAAYYDFHPLMTEDILNTEHLPKSEEYENHFFFTIKMLRIIVSANKFSNQNSTKYTQEHVSLVLGNHYVISFQDDVEGDVFSNIRLRIQSGKGRVRSKGSDYLFYALLDSIVDYYFLIMEDMRIKIENIEDSILENPGRNAINIIIAIKKQQENIRRIFFPLKEAVDKIFKEEPKLITESVFPYFRDILDHIINLSTSFEGFKDSVSSLMEMNMSNMSNSLNAIIKTLTIFSMFFVPLTFIVGIYGMNFEYMPELAWKFGYFVIWGIMILTGTLMLIFLKWKKWL